MKKFMRWSAVMLAVLLLTGLAACGEEKPSGTGETPPEQEGPKAPVAADYDANGLNGLYYQNAVSQFGSAPVMGDPFLYYEEADKTFYLYGTTGGRRFDFYTSKDLVEWTEGGTCFLPTESDWCHSRLWAPELHKIGGKYWLYYSAGADDGAMLHCSVAVGDSPAGPFSNNIDETATSASPRFDFGFPSIDGTVFEDEDGSLYYYFAKDQVNGVSTIWGVQLENPYTVKEGCEAVQLTRVGYADMTGSVRMEWESKQGQWNEGPFMVKHEGTYYLTYSANHYQSKYYGVGYATSTEPLANFVKPEDSMLLGTEPQSDASKEWDYVSGTGHHMFLKIGDEDFIVYHKHYNIKAAGNVRIFTLDRYGYRDDGSMYVNGSTLSPQPMPALLSGYSNVARNATIGCSGVDSLTRRLLRDGGIGVYPRNAEKTDVSFPAGKTTIKVSFREPTAVRAVLLYAGTDYDKILKKVDKISFGEECYVTNVRLDGNYLDTQRGYMAVGNALSATLNKDVTVTEIEIVIDAAEEFSLSEIVVLGR